MPTRDYFFKAVQNLFIKVHDLSAFFKNGLRVKYGFTISNECASKFNC